MGREREGSQVRQGSPVYQALCPPPFAVVLIISISVNETKL